MTDRLTTKQQVPLTESERNDLRELASEHGTTAGLLSRALLLQGLAALRAGSATAVETVVAEKAAAAKRLSDGAKAAIAHRWRR